MTPTASKVVATLAVAVLLVVGLLTYQSERSRCITETTAPFFAHTARGLSTALDGSDVTPAGREDLAGLLSDDADRLDTVADRCRWPW